VTLVWRPGFAYDTDASAYIDAVEAADEIASPGIGALETATRYAINDFVLGCKQDGIWTAIKASCILSGARTLAGALVPLAGTAPTNFNFVSGDYNRKTGLRGNASNKYLDSNRNNNADPQNNKHLAAWVSQAANAVTNGAIIGAYSSSTSASFIGRNNAQFFTFLNSTGTIFGDSTLTGFQGISRSQSSNYQYRLGVSGTLSVSSVSHLNQTITIFRASAFATSSNARLAFYSIGESLDLALLDTRVSTLIAQFGAVIP
jgi:hypothetical protein